MCAAEGCPVAIEVFAGNVADPKTLSTPIAKLRERFALRHVIRVGDRGMISQARIARKAGAVLDRRPMAKHFDLDIADDHFVVARKTAAIAAAAALDGLYAVRTLVPADRLDDAAIVAASNSLSQVERAFRSLKTVDRDIRLQTQGI